MRGARAILIPPILEPIHKPMSKESTDTGKEKAQLWELHCRVPREKASAYREACQDPGWPGKPAPLNGIGDTGALEATLTGTEKAVKTAGEKLEKAGFKPAMSPKENNPLEKEIKLAAGSHQNGMPRQKLIEAAMKIIREALAHLSGEPGPLAEETLAALEKSKALIPTPDGKLRLEETQPEWRQSKSTREDNMLLGFFQTNLHELQARLAKADSEWGGEDPFYRYFHQSFKVYGTDEKTTEITAFLDRAGNHAYGEGNWKKSGFVEEILADGQGRVFSHEHNRAWRENAKPILDAFLYAREFLRLAGRYAGKLKTAPQALPSGWAALLYYYGKR